MKPRHFDAWVQALRKPGVWTQGVGQFEEAGRFCAVGVALRVDRWTRGLSRREEASGSVVYSFAGSDMWAFPNADYLHAAMIPRDLVPRLIDMNDGGVSFPNIATFLMEHSDEIVS